ncbi:MAG: class II fructose-bisphosphate aldolase [Erysipelotrichaceae bacterium]|jgi:fructose-bisphosphate aldolase class II|nr:class II fructose-bisphosphate aldolase [Erysipelotrichaceae bacterium]
MLVGLDKVLEYAEMNKTAIGAFNVACYEHIEAILRAAEKLNVPVILSFAQTHEENHIAYLDEMGPLMVLKAKESKVPVAVHLDHGIDLAYLKEALDLGFTSIMFDGSSLPFDTNVEKTKEAVKLAKEYGVCIEAEIGKMAGITLNNQGITENRKSSRSNYTDPQEAKKFVELTDVDCLAASFGTVHGKYFSEPHLDFELVSEIYHETKVPVVMHGGSGVSKEDYKKVIESGVRKINYYTYMDMAGANAIKNADFSVFADASNIAKEAMMQDVAKAMKIFNRME